MTWNNIEVHSARHCTMEFEVFVHESRAGDTEHGDVHIEAVRQINTEDIVPNAGVFAGLQSRYATAGVHHPLEAALDRFTDWHLARLG